MVHGEALGVICREKGPMSRTGHATESRNRESTRAENPFSGRRRPMPLLPFPFSLSNNKLLCEKGQRKNADFCNASGMGATGKVGRALRCPPSGTGTGTYLT